jgi:hypothetical protein
LSLFICFPLICIHTLHPRTSIRFFFLIRLIMPQVKILGKYLDGWQFFLFPTITLGVECALKCFAGKIKLSQQRNWRMTKIKCVYSSSMPSNMVCMGMPWTFNPEVRHDALEDRKTKIINISRSMHKRLLISSKFYMVSEGKHWRLLDIRRPWRSTINAIGGSYKQLWPNHRTPNVLKSVLDNTRRWSKIDITPLFEFRFNEWPHVGKVIS